MGALQGQIGEGAQPRGTDATRSYYEVAGWLPGRDGVLSDMLLWGSPHRGPVREASHRLRRHRVKRALSQAGGPLELLECGCGGNPALDLLPLCRRYTGLDFSQVGLAAARARLAPHGTAFRLVEGDMCALPFPDGSFDAVYSSNALYHIIEPSGQAAALREMARVLRPGGAAVLILSNPRALLFPYHTLRRLAADAPWIGPVLQRLRPRPPIPYNPRPVPWMRRILDAFGTVDVIGYTLPSVWFNKRVGEVTAASRLTWRSLAWLEREQPHLSARLGCYVQLSLRKHE